MAKEPEKNWRRWTIRVLVLAVFGAAGYFALLAADAPQKLPAVALGQEALYRLELLLVCVFGALLLLTPLVQGVLNGRLPTEISARGAQYAEDVTEGLESAEQRIAEVEELGKKHAAALIKLRADVNKLAPAGGHATGAAGDSG